jgi:hypothetical protein
MLMIRLGMAQVFNGHQRPNQQRVEKQQQRVERPFKEAKMADKLRRMQDLKFAFMTKQVNLSPVEAEKFWPVYKQFQTELDAALIEKRLNNSPDQVNGQDQVNKELEIEEKIVNIRRHYNAEFQKMLPPEKISQVYKSQKDFTDLVIRHNAEKKGEANN